MIHFNTSFFHNVFKVAIRNTIPDIKENSIKNDIFWKVSTFEAEHVIHLLLKLRIMIADNVGKGDLCDRTINSQLKFNIEEYKNLEILNKNKDYEKIIELLIIKIPDRSE
ncbi:hypothetical protein BPLS_P0787 [Bathymodiolus platifrons methanotrophic gill symbiont]|nr:hypothetical protein BPLS_P0787 [Bathymodiolus platifrons methanotrophic gill symbiont]